MDLNKHTFNDNNKPFHSSGYARIASGDRIGSVGSLSFNQRQHIDNNRQTIDLYKRSAMGRARGVLKAKQFDRSSAPVDVNKSSNSLQQYNSNAPVVRRFTEPSSRGYNPYA